MAIIMDEHKEEEKNEEKATKLPLKHYTYTTTTQTRRLKPHKSRKAHRDNVTGGRGKAAHSQHH